MQGDHAGEPQESMQLVRTFHKAMERARCRITKVRVHGRQGGTFGPGAAGRQTQGADWTGEGGKERPGPDPTG